MTSAMRLSVVCATAGGISASETSTKRAKTTLDTGCMGKGAFQANQRPVGQCYKHCPEAVMNRFVRKKGGQRQVRDDRCHAKGQMEPGRVPRLMLHRIHDHASARGMLRPMHR